MLSVALPLARVHKEKKGGGGARLKMNFETVLGRPVPQTAANELVFFFRSCLVAEEAVCPSGISLNQQLAAEASN